MPAPLSILLPAWHHVPFDGVPIYRAQAWALKDARLHGEHFAVASGDRRTSVIKAFNKAHGTDLHDQAYLSSLWIRTSALYGKAGAIARGVYPANPPTQGTHLLLGDGVVGRVGEHLPKFKLGIDATSAGEDNACASLVHWLNSHGYSVTRPYSSGSEAHHLVFTKGPATNARRRLAAYYAAGR